MKDNNITVLIQTYNEEKNVEACIESLKGLTDDVIVVDSESTDNTVSVTQKLGVKIFTVPHVDYVEPAREFGIKKTESEWVFILDADERMTPELAQEIKKSLSADYSFYRVPRKEIVGKIKWLRHGGWWPNYQIRLIRIRDFVEWPTAIHSTPVIKGKIGQLIHPLLHYSQNDFESIVKKTIIFEDQESELLYKAGRTVSTLTFFRKFLGELHRRLIKHMGFLDGEIGIIESIYQAFSKTVTYIYLYEKRAKKVAGGSL